MVRKEKRIVTPFNTYSPKVIEHFRHPRNIGAIKNPDGVGRVGNIRCGDVMWCDIKVGKRGGQEIIQNIKVRTMGCVAAISTSSYLTEAVKDKTIQQALRITHQDIASGLGGLPAPKLHCSVLAVDALAEAIYDYLSRQGRPIPAELAKRHTRLQEVLAAVEKK